MPTKKQRRRREKGRRHEWEEVWVDDDGRELSPEEVEELDGGAAATAVKTESRSKTSAKPAQKKAGGRPAREVKPPSWQRVIRRGAIFAPVMFVVISLLSRDLSVQAKLLQTLFLLVFFVPFSYLMDTMMYRSYRKRIGEPPAPTSTKKRG